MTCCCHSICLCLLNQGKTFCCNCYSSIRCSSFTCSYSSCSFVSSCSPHPPKGFPERDRHLRLPLNKLLSASCGTSIGQGLSTPSYCHWSTCVPTKSLLCLPGDDLRPSMWWHPHYWSWAQRPRLYPSSSRSPPSTPRSP